MTTKSDFKTLEHRVTVVKGWLINLSQKQVDSLETGCIVIRLAANGFMSFAASLGSTFGKLARFPTRPQQCWKLRCEILGGGSKPSHRSVKRSGFGPIFRKPSISASPHCAVNRFVKEHHLPLEISGMTWVLRKPPIEGKLAREDSNI